MIKKETLQKGAKVASEMAVEEAKDFGKSIIVAWLTKVSLIVIAVIVIIFGAYFTVGYMKDLAVDAGKAVVTEAKESVQTVAKASVDKTKEVTAVVVGKTNELKEDVNESFDNVKADVIVLKSGAVAKVESIKDSSAETYEETKTKMTEKLKSFDFSFNKNQEEEK